MSFFRANAAITGGSVTAATIDNCVVGGTTPAAGTFVALTTSGAITATGAVDHSIGSTSSSAGAITLNLSGGGTGTMVMSTDSTAVQAIQLTTTGAGANIVLNPQNEIDVSNKKIVNIATPTAGGDAVNKTYADGLSGGGTWNAAASNGAGVVTLTLAGGGASDHFVMDMSADAGNVTGTLANGSGNGQLCHLLLAVEGGGGFTGGTHTCKITVTSFLDSGGGATNTLSFDHEGQSATLVWLTASSKWHVLATGATLE